MFQYAAARAISESLGGDIVLLYNGDTDYRPILFLKGRQSPPLMPRTLYMEPSPFVAWSPEGFRGTDILQCNGQFQYLPAIQQVVPFVRDEFLTALAPLRKELIKKYTITMPRRIGFVYIGRHDEFPKKQDYQPKTQIYYEAAMQEMEISTRKSIHWYVLSDDPAWCRIQPWLQGKQIIEESELASLAFMSLCEGAAVIANSAFSWWGAILAGAPTAYPARWLPSEAPDLFPSSWKGVQG